MSWLRLGEALLDEGDAVGHELIHLARSRSSERDIGTITRPQRATCCAQTDGSSGAQARAALNRSRACALVDGCVSGRHCASCRRQRLRSEG